MLQPLKLKNCLFSLLFILIGFVYCNELWSASSAPATSTTPASPPPISPPPSPIAPQTPKPESSTVITDAVMAKSIQPETFRPIDITNSFPTNQKVFHAIISLVNAPQNTTVKVVWETANDQKIAEFELTSSGTRNLDFTLTSATDYFPAGEYKAAIFLNGVYNRTLPFSVISTTPVQPTNAPSHTTDQTTIPPTSKVPTTNPLSPTSFISEVVMAQDTSGDAKEPVHPTSIFQPNSTIHAVIRTQNAPTNTVFKASWYVTDVGTVASPNTLIDAVEFSTEGTRNIDFTLKPTTTWPEGTYHVDISVNGKVEFTKEYSVKNP